LGLDDQIPSERKKSSNSGREVPLWGCFGISCGKIFGGHQKWVPQRAPLKVQQSAPRIDDRRRLLGTSGTAKVAGVTSTMIELTQISIELPEYL